MSLLWRFYVDSRKDSTSGTASLVLPSAVCRLRYLLCLANSQNLSRRLSESSALLLRRLL